MKAKTGAESPPAPSSSALAAKLRTLHPVGCGIGTCVEEAKIIEEAASTLDAQATDKAAAVEKVKALKSGEFSSATNYDLGFEACKSQVLTILTDSQPKEEAGR